MTRHAPPHQLLRVGAFNPCEFRVQSTEYAIVIATCFTFQVEISPRESKSQIICLALLHVLKFKTRKRTRNPVILTNLAIECIFVLTPPPLTTRTTVRSTFLKIALHVYTRRTAEHTNTHFQCSQNAELQPTILGLLALFPERHFKN